MKQLLLSLLMIPGFSLIIVACGEAGDATPHDQGAQTPPEQIEFEELIERADQLVGATVEVTAFYWSDGEEMYLSRVLMESYPPQIPKATSIVLVGQVPDDVLNALERSEPPYGNITWGSVTVTGTVTSSGDVDRVTVEIVSIEVER